MAAGRKKSLEACLGSDEREIQEEDLIPALRAECCSDMKFARLYRNVLSAEECVALIKATERAGYSSLAHEYNKSYRNNDRVIIEDAAFSQRVLSRVLPFLPKERRQGREVLVGLNECLRCCRYDPGGHFSAHKDGEFTRNSKERSRITFMLYLNGDFEGGETRFLRDARGPGRRPVHLIKPEPGLLLAFEHDILHDGNRVEGGRKYILRSDVMYRDVDEE